MQPISTDVELVLANRHFLYTLFGRIFGDEPNEALIEVLNSEHVAEELACAAQRDAALKVAIAALEVPSSQDVEALECVRSAYTRLFIGPAQPPVALWESLYVNGEPLLFQESTFAVRQAYRAAGFIPEGYPHVADDHIAIEFNFLAALSEEACDEACPAPLEDVLEVHAAFLDDHLLRWLSDFAKRMEVLKSNNHFYPRMARFAAAFVACDKRWIAQTLDRR